MRVGLGLLSPGVGPALPVESLGARLEAAGVRQRRPFLVRIGEIGRILATGGPLIGGASLSRHAGAVVPLPLVHDKSVPSARRNRNASARRLAHGGHLFALVQEFFSPPQVGTAKCLLAKASLPSSPG